METVAQTADRLGGIAEVAEGARAELARRRGPREVAARLRARFDDHPKQRRFWQSIARRLWALCTRRAGKSDGGVREWLAKALTIPGWRGLYVHETKAEARRIVWKNDMGQGWLDLLSQFGEVSGDGWILGGIEVTKNDTLLEINFSNGSQIAIFCADDEGALERVRGIAKDEIWVDEAQKFVHLRKFIEDDASACLKDKSGRLRLTGTPSEDCAGYFYECSPEPDSGDAPLPNWEGHRWSVTDNPWFGRVTAGDDGWYVMADQVKGDPVQVAGPFEDRVEADRIAEQTRWDRTAGEELQLHQWTGEEPKFQREWRGKWVKGDAHYVYPVHAVPERTLLFAPQRLRENTFRPAHAPWYDHQAALADLPFNRRARRSYQWLFAIGADFGYWPDAFALVVWAFTQELPDVYEMFSWKQTEVNTHDKGIYMKMLSDELPSLVSFVGDTVDREKGDMWRNRMNLEFDTAEKLNKNVLEGFLADDIRRGAVHLRDGSPLYTEMKHLVYLPTKPGRPRVVDKHRSVGGVVHGDHACFVEGTMVKTADGPRAVERVAVGDLVWTRAGLRSVTSTMRSGVRDLWKLETDDGRVLVGTGDHPIWTDNGRVPLALLTPGVMLMTWESTAPLNSSSSTAGDFADTQNPPIEPCESISSARSRSMASDVTRPCIERSGNTTTERFRPDATSITGTKIRSTTTPTTSWLSLALSMLASMPPRRIESRRRSEISRPPALSPLSGMAHRLDVSGTPSTAADPWSSASSLSSLADIVVAASTRSSPAPSSAAMHVKQLHDMPAESMTRIVRVLNALADSGLTDIESRPRAPVRVARVVTLGFAAPVYNLTVDDAHEYFANGILVSNCDAARYSFTDLTHFLAKPHADAKPPTEIEVLRSQAERFEKSIDRADDRQRARAREADAARWGMAERGPDQEYEENYGYEY